MKVDIPAARLLDPEIARAAEAIQACVHCGFCTATCPTYQLQKDERDSPRGRIVLAHRLLAGEDPPDPAAVTHLDRCLSCLGCETTCPSGVKYRSIIDAVRPQIESARLRPWPERVLRSVLGHILPFPRRVRLALLAGQLARPFSGLLPQPLREMLAMGRAWPKGMGPLDAPGIYPAKAGAVTPRRVILFRGCVQGAIRPGTEEAALDLLRRLGADVQIVQGQTCCGALNHHLGQAQQAHHLAAANLRALTGTGEAEAIVTLASGCGTHLKDYGTLFPGNPEAASIAARAKDLSEIVALLGFPALPAKPDRVAYHPPCSLTHGQKISQTPQRLLRLAGYQVIEPAESHLCCGSAGTYNILQPEFAGRLGERKARTILETGADMFVTGNLGCQLQIARYASLPGRHLAELLLEALLQADPADVPADLKEILR